MLFWAFPPIPEICILLPKPQITVQPKNNGQIKPHLQQNKQKHSNDWKYPRSQDTVPVRPFGCARLSVAFSARIPFSVSAPATWTVISESVSIKSINASLKSAKELGIKIDALYGWPFKRRKWVFGGDKRFFRSKPSEVGKKLRLRFIDIKTDAARLRTPKKCAISWQRMNVIQDPDLCIFANKW